MATHPTGKAPHAYSRLGLIIAIVLCLAGLGSLALGVMPAEWRQQAATYAGDEWQSLLTLGDRLVPLAIGAACFLVGLIALVVVVRRGRKRSSPSSRAGPSDAPSEAAGALGAVRVNDMAPTSVYLDLENKPLAASQVTPFVHLLRESIKRRTGSERADLFFYCDVSNVARGSTYQSLQEYGFQAVDVPHRRFDESAAQRDEAQPTGVNLKNFVDVEMALHAHYRALLAPAPQLVIIISEDVDFIPLVRRLRRLGHDVQIWSRETRHDFKRLESTLGVETVSFGHLIPHGGGSSDASRTVTRKAIAPRVSPPQPVSGPEGRILTAIDATFKSIELTETARRSNPGSAKHWGAVLRSRLGGWQDADGQGDLLARLGYDDSGAQMSPNRVQFWLDELQALGALSDGQGPLPVRGIAQPSEAAALLYGFLQRYIVDALVSWQQRGRADDPFSAVCEYVVSRASESEPQPIRSLRYLLSKDASSYYLRHARYLCQCARSLGLTEVNLTAAATQDESAAAPVAAPPPAEGQA